MGKIPKKMIVILVLMALAYAAFAFSIEYAKRHPIADAPIPPGAGSSGDKTP